MSPIETGGTPNTGAVPDESHVGDIRGALGTTRRGEGASRETWHPRQDHVCGPRPVAHRHARQQRRQRLWHQIHRHQLGPMAPLVRLLIVMLLGYLAVAGGLMLGRIVRFTISQG